MLIAFSNSSKPVGFRAISMSFLNFLSQKTYHGEFFLFETDVIKEKVVFKTSAEAHQSSIIKNTINSKMFGGRG